MAKEDTKGMEENQNEEEEENNNNNDNNEGGDNQGKGGSDNDDKGGNKKEKTFSQKQVDRMMEKEKEKSRAAAFKELGIDPKDEKAIKMFQALVESQKTDEQKEAEKKAESDKAAAEQERRVLIAEAKAEAMIAGVQKAFVDDAVTLAIARMKENEGADLATVFGELKTKYPMYFDKPSDEEEDEKKAGRKGTGSTIKGNNGGTRRKPSGKDDNESFGARLAARRSAGAKKVSYWGNK